MVKRTPNMSSLVVSAIRGLRGSHGATYKEIIDYVSSRRKVSDTSFQRQMRTALKRGLSYGILKRINGRYTLNTDLEEVKIPRTVPLLKREGRKRTKRRNIVTRKKRSVSSRARKGTKGKKRGNKKVRKIKSKSARYSRTTKRVRKEPIVHDDSDHFEQQDAISGYQNEDQNRIRSREPTPFQKAPSSSSSKTQNDIDMVN